MSVYKRVQDKEEGETYYEDPTFGLHNVKFNSFTEGFVTGNGKVNNIAVAEDKNGSLKFVMAKIIQTEKNVLSKLYHRNREG